MKRLTEIPITDKQRGCTPSIVRAAQDLDGGAWMELPKFRMNMGAGTRAGCFYCHKQGITDGETGTYWVQEKKYTVCCDCVEVADAH